MFQDKKTRTEEDKSSVIIFKIGWEEFAIELLDVKEIIQAGQIRRLPKSLDFIEGIYNYRGDIIYIINLKKKLNLDQYLLYKSKVAQDEEKDEKDDDENSESTQKFIVIVNVNNKNIGFIVDRIMNVAYVNEKNLENMSPIFQTSLELSYIKNIIKFEDRPRILIDLGKVLSEAEQIIIQKEILT